MTRESDKRIGWHVIGDGRLEVWVDEDGRVTRGTYDGIKPVFPYRYNGRTTNWERYDPTLSSLRHAMKKGTMRML